MHAPRAVVLAPAPLLTVTVESTATGDEIHLHPGGQGTWIARLVAELGVEAELCCTFGGETGTVVRTLLEGWGIRLRAVEAAGWNGAYIHDRRSGERRPVAEMEPPLRSRHEVDELYGAVLVPGLEADVVVLGGPERSGLSRTGHSDVVPDEVYARLAADLHGRGPTVVADLSGTALDAALTGGLDVVKVSDEELRLHGHVGGASRHDLADAACRLHERGAGVVVVTCGEAPSLALVEGTLHQVTPPQVTPVDSRGAGDSVTAGMAAGLARGYDVLDAVRLGVAAGALNVTRRGLASGSRQEIEQLATQVEVTEV